MEKPWSVRGWSFLIVTQGGGVIFPKSTKILTPTLLPRAIFCTHSLEWGMLYPPPQVRSRICLTPSPTGKSSALQADFSPPPLKMYTHFFTSLKITPWVKIRSTPYRVHKVSMFSRAAQKRIGNPVVPICTSCKTEAKKREFSVFEPVDNVQWL